MATVVSQLARMRATLLENSSDSQNQGQCGVLNTMMERYVDTNQPFLGRVSDLLDLITTNFEGMELEARDEAAIVAKVLRVVTGLVHTFADDDQLQGLALKMARKEMEKNSGGPPSHWEGSDYGDYGDYGDHSSHGGGSWGESHHGHHHDYHHRLINTIIIVLITTIIKITLPPKVEATGMG